MKFTHTYWNGNGLYQKKLNEMEAAGWNEKYTKKSQATARRYYRYFNDGDIPRGMRWETEFIIERALEAQAHEMIKAEYKRFQKAMEKEAK